MGRLEDIVFHKECVRVCGVKKKQVKKYSAEPQLFVRNHPKHEALLNIEKESTLCMFEWV